MFVYCMYQGNHVHLLESPSPYITLKQRNFFKWPMQFSWYSPFESYPLFRSKLLPFFLSFNVIWKSNEDHFSLNLQRDHSVISPYIIDFWKCLASPINFIKELVVETWQTQLMAQCPLRQTWYLGTLLYGHVTRDMNTVQAVQHPTQQYAMPRESGIWLHLPARVSTFYSNFNFSVSLCRLNTSHLASSYLENIKCKKMDLFDVKQPRKVQIKLF